MAINIINCYYIDKNYTTKQIFDQILVLAINI